MPPCAEHIILIHGLIRDARKRNRSIFVVFLDLAKTFDSVDHDLLFRGLRRQSCPDDFIEVVKELYDGTFTRISIGRSVTTEIEIRSGVKQGCSLSPLLFNTVIDKLSGEGNVRSIVDAGIWGAEISVLERKLARTRSLNPCARCAFNQFRWEKWRKSTQGRGVKTFTGRLNCRWLHDGLCDRRRCEGAFISASMLRTQTLPCGESLVQDRGKSISSCRACGEGAETISDILKNCRSTTHMRIWRPNMEIDVVKKRIRKEGYVVLNKPRVVSHEKDQLLRPGLCAKKDGKAMVLDALVPYKTSAKRLAIARNDKIKKYAPHGDVFRRYLGCDDLIVDGVVVEREGPSLSRWRPSYRCWVLGPERWISCRRGRSKARGPFSNGSWVGSRPPCGKEEVVKDRYTRPSRGAGIDRKAKWKYQWLVYDHRLDRSQLRKTTSRCDKMEKSPVEYESRRCTCAGKEDRPAHSQRRPGPCDTRINARRAL